MHIPLENAKFNLNASGIPAFFGGEESFAAMSSVHLLQWRRFLAWYNSPGSYLVAKKYGKIPPGRLWKGLFPGENNGGAEEMLGLNGKPGSRYFGAQSRTSLNTTGHLVHLLEAHCQHLESEQGDGSKDNDHPGAPDYTLTIVELNPYVDPFGNGKDYGNPLQLPSMSNLDIILVTFTITFSLAAAIFPLILWHDWACFAAIFVGILCNGISCIILGSGHLELRGPGDKALPFYPVGDGILGGATRGKPLILVQGPESAVVDLTRGRYHLRYGSAPKHHWIGFASMLLTIQALAQLIIFPQATVFGQILFLATLIVSYMYNAYLASKDREKLQTKILLDRLWNPRLLKYSFARWAAVVTASAFYLQPANKRAYLDQLIPNDTPSWSQWKECVVNGLILNKSPQSLDCQNADRAVLDANEEKLLRDALDNANIGYEWFVRTTYQTSIPITATSNVYQLPNPGQV